MYIAKYKEDEPYFIVPWDLDATFGRLYSNSIRLTTPNGVLRNRLYTRLLDANNVRCKQ